MVKNVVTVLLWTISVWIYKIRKRYFDPIRDQHEVEQKLKNSYLVYGQINLILKLRISGINRNTACFGGWGQIFRKKLLPPIQGNYSSATWKQDSSLLFSWTLLSCWSYVIGGHCVFCAVGIRSIEMIFDKLLLIKSNMICVSKLLYGAIAVLRIIYYLKHSWNYPLPMETEVI